MFVHVDMYTHVLTLYKQVSIQGVHAVYTRHQFTNGMVKRACAHIEMLSVHCACALRFVLCADCVGSPCFAWRRVHDYSDMPSCAATQLTRLAEVDIAVWCV